MSNNRNREQTASVSNEPVVDASAAGIVTNGELVQQTDQHASAGPFGEPIIVMPKNPTVNDKYGRTSTAVVNVSVPVRGAGLSIESAIYATVVSKDGERQIDYSVYLPGKAVSAASPDDKQRFCEHVELAAAAWAGWGRADTLATQRLSDHVSGVKRNAGVIPADAPRLVSKRLGILPGAATSGLQTVRAAV